MLPISFLFGKLICEIGKLKCYRKNILMQPLDNLGMINSNKLCEKIKSETFISMTSNDPAEQGAGIVLA